MDQLRFTGLYEDGAHLVLTAADGTDYSVPVDDRLRAALRPAAGDQAARSVPATPREVQTRIRAGASAEEICEDTGWSVERVRRFEGPILAERAYVAVQAQAAAVRSHERGTPPPTLQPRVRERLAARGVDTEHVSWDATRPDGGQWSVRVQFMAGQRIRHATWTFDPVGRSVEAVDDEARWLSEDEQSLPAGGASSALFGGGTDSPDDLMSSIRERSRRRGHGSRSSSGRARGENRAARREGRPGVVPAAEPEARPDDAEEQGFDVDPDASSDPSAVPGRTSVPEQALPLEDLPYDPDTMGLPPAAGRPAEEEEAETSDEPVGAGADEAGLEDEQGFEETREATLADFFGDDEEDEEQDPPESEPGETPREESAPSDGSAKERGQRRGRPSVPSWDDIMFGARDR